MKHWKQLLLLTALLITALVSATSLPAQQWRGIQALPQDMIVSESFDEDSQLDWHTWTAAEPSISQYHGMYQIRANASSELEHWFDLPLSQYDNYELDLSVALKNSGRSLDDSYGFIFGTLSSGERLAFTLGSNGQYSLSELDFRGDAFVWQYDHAPELVPYRFQQFVVRKVGDHVTFMVDGQEIYGWTYDGISGSRIGLLLSEGAEVLVDHIRVMRLGGPTIPERRPAEIELTTPLINWDDHYAHTESWEPVQHIRGEITPTQNWVALYINDQLIAVKEDGSFSASVNLEAGENSIRFNALLPEGKQIHRLLNVQHLVPQPLFEVEPQRETRPVATIEPEDFPVLQQGRNFLVLIGVNQYNYWNDLHNAVKDCEDVAKVLIDHYQFEPNYVIRLYNEQADRVGILETMEWLQEEMDADDNLLIYYAGHGFYDEQADLGFWVPADGRMDKVPDYIPNSTIHDYIATINCQHTLLIADACFSGSLLSGMRGNSSVREKSRWVFASGDASERVFDGAPGTNSPFAEEMIEFLMENRYRQFMASELIEYVSAGVSERVRQHPVGSPLVKAGDNGGVFPFYPKN